VIVAAGHLRCLFFVDYRNTHSRDPFTGFLYAVTGIGHQAVMVFFVLSGFFISATVLKHRPETWSARTYATNRLVRLYIVLIPALLLTAASDLIGRALPAGSTWFDQPVRNLQEIPVAARLTVQAFIGNLAFLQTLCVPTFGSNGALWSLANEFWYYLLFPLLFVTFRPFDAVRRLAAGSLALLLLVALPGWFWRGFLVWALGCSLHFLPRMKALSITTVRSTVLTGTILLFGFTLVVIRGGHLEEGSDFAVGASFALVLYVILHSTGRSSSAYRGSAGVLAGFSFSMYAIHLPLLMLIRTAVSRTGYWQPGVKTAVAAGAILGIVLGVSYLFSRLTEARTEKLRQRLFGPKLDRHLS
jgi:peptidoglycan/LPS O-acetylase OafA/YrhL